MSKLKQIFGRMFMKSTKQMLCLILSCSLVAPLHAMKKGMKPQQKIEESKESDSTDSIDSFEIIENEQFFEQNQVITENILPSPPPQDLSNNQLFEQMKEMMRQQELKHQQQLKNQELRHKKDMMQMKKQLKEQKKVINELKSKISEIESSRSNDSNASGQQEDIAQSEVTTVELETVYLDESGNPILQPENNTHQQLLQSNPAQPQQQINSQEDSSQAEYESVLLDENDNPLVQGQENNANTNEISVNPPADSHDSEELSVEELNDPDRAKEETNWVGWIAAGISTFGLFLAIASLLGGCPKPLQDYFNSNSNGGSRGGTGGAVGY